MMKPTTFRRAAVAGLLSLGLGASVLGLDVAWAQSTAPLKEAWYQHTPVDEPLSPLCGAGIPAPGCAGEVTGPARSSDHPEDTLHVAVDTGLIDATTFLEIARPRDDARSAVLILPVAPAEDGTANEGRIRFQACPATGEIEDGAEAAPPGEAPVVDCSVAVRATPQFVDGTLARFEIDLAPLLTAQQEATFVLALVPTEAARSEQDTWHVAFSGRDRQGSTVPGLFVGVDQPATTAEPEPEPAPAATQPARPSGPLFPAPSQAVPPAVSDDPAPVVAAPATPEVVTAPAPAEIGPRRVVFPVGLLYPGVFAVPLALAVVGGLAANALRRPLPLDDQREPAAPPEPAGALATNRPRPT